MRDWTDLDREAAREGFAILRAMQTHRPRKPHGVSKEDIKRNAIKQKGVLCDQ